MTTAPSTAATPTDAERRAVDRVVELAETTDAPSWLLTQIRGAAAQALADQRARYEAVANEIADWRSSIHDDPMWAAGYGDGARGAAERIRQVSR